MARASISSIISGCAPSFRDILPLTPSLNAFSTTSIIFFLLSALLSLSGLDFITAISGAATSISNVGPGLGSIIGPNGNFSSLPDISKWILTLGMILGRLELFAILVLFLPSFWRN